jgi:hypothetical protein
MLKDISCGCLSIRKDGQSLKGGDMFSISGGETVLVSMEMHLPMYAGKNEYGAMFIAENNGLEHNVEIVMSCPVIGDISIDPKITQLAFERDDTINQQFSVFLTRASHDKSALDSMPSVGKLPKHITLQRTSIYSNAKETVPGIWQKEWQFDFNVARPDEMAMLEAPLSIDFSATGRSVGFSIILTKTYGIDYPKQVDFSDAKPGETKTRVFSLQSASDMAFEIKSVSCNNNSYFTVSANQVSGKSKQHWIEVAFTPQSVGENVATLSIETSHPDSNQVVIELNGTCFSDN